MNMQAMMKQAQALQKEMMNIKNEIDNTEFTGESSIVKVTINGKKEVLDVKIDSSSDFSKDDIEMLQDMIVVAVNAATKKVDDTVNQKMAKFGNMPGMF